MKKLYTMSAAAIFLTLFLSASASAQDDLKTVTDFYLAMPSGSYDLLPEGEGDSYLFREDEEVKGKAAITKFRRSLIKIEDVKNGYLRLESNLWEGGWMEIALFKKTDGSSIAAISQVECGPGCSGGAQFLTYSNGKWADVSSQYFPKLSKAQDEARDQGCYFKLPRAGRTLKMWCGDTEEDGESKGREFSFEWNGAKFIGKQIYD